MIEQMAKKYPSVNFIQINSDKSEISQERGVKALPTFQFYINGRMVDEVTGGDPNKVEAMVMKHKVDVVESFAGYFHIDTQYLLFSLPISCIELKAITL